MRKKYILNPSSGSEISSSAVAMENISQIKN